MRLEKILAIKSVGRFKDSRATGDVGFRRLTVVYGDNGSGKTTLTSILRSFATNDHRYVSERATLGSTSPPEIDLLLQNSERAKFHRDTWSATTDEVEVFDSAFVTDNIFAGEFVEPNHRTKVYEVIVGKSAVDLARQVNELDAENRDCAAKANDLEVQIRLHIEGQVQTDEFLRLSPIADNVLSNELDRATKDLDAIRKSSSLRAMPVLARVPVPTIPTGIRESLDKEISPLSAATADRVRRHIRSINRDGAESWLQQGVAFAASDLCPFCGQTTRGIELVDQFRSFFSREYEAQINEFRFLRNAVDSELGQMARTSVLAVAQQNRTILAAWSEFYASPELDARLDLSQLATKMERVYSVFYELLQLKISRPADRFAIDSVRLAQIEELSGDLSALSRSNELIDAANVELNRIKAAALSGDADEAESRIQGLKNTSTRHSAPIRELCDRFVAQRQSKASLEARKASVRELMRTTATELLSKYQSSINTWLESFGASFRLDGLKPAFAGGRATSDYSIRIDQHPVALGDSRTPRGTRCFRTALSSGDRSALALAFFLARLQADERIAQKLVVFDDPVTSLDNTRRTFTQAAIAGFASKAAQIIVLSHDPFFLNGVVDAVGTANDIGSIRIRQSPAGSIIDAWDVSDWCVSTRHHDYFALKTFLDVGLREGQDVLSIARSVRPYVEGHFEYLFPDKFARRAQLGDMIGVIRSATSNDPLATLQPLLPQLQELNLFARKVHHTEPAAAGQITNEGETRAAIEKAFRIVRRNVGA